MGIGLRCPSARIPDLAADSIQGKGPKSSIEASLRLVRAGGNPPDSRESQMPDLRECLQVSGRSGRYERDEKQP
jgi:hypothetical protein